MKVNYQELEEAISHMDAYTHGSSHATSVFHNGDHTYKVWSYSTLMLEVFNDEIVYFNPQHYSMTTSRLQNIIRRSFNHELLEAASKAEV